MALPPLRCIVRDGVEADTDGCLALDHRFETEHVLQIHIHQDEARGWEISISRERLPRMLELSFSADRTRLLSVMRSGCFLVAASPAADTLYGYLAMTNDGNRRIGLIHDIVIGRRFRRQQVATRLAGAARTWAREHGLTRLMFETSTKNIPAITFAQQAGFTFCGFNDRYFPNQDVAVFFSQMLR
jgi:RimJ/RimL family protein N-acetyltransferase